MSEFEIVRRKDRFPNGSRLWSQLTRQSSARVKQDVWVRRRNFNDPSDDFQKVAPCSISSRSVWYRGNFTRDPSDDFQKVAPCSISSRRVWYCWGNFTRDPSDDFERSVARAVFHSRVDRVWYWGNFTRDPSDDFHWRGLCKSIILMEVLKVPATIGFYLAQVDDITIAITEG